MDQTTAEASPAQKRLYNEPANSDVLIRYSGQTVCAHRDILCKGAVHFRNMLKGDFAESKQAEVTLHDDYAPAVIAALRHLYGHEYTNPDSAEWTDYNDPSPHIRVYIVADKYRCESLRHAVLLHVQMILHRQSCVPYASAMDWAKQYDVLPNTPWNPHATFAYEPLDENHIDPASPEFEVEFLNYRGEFAKSHPSLQTSQTQSSWSLKPCLAPTPSDDPGSSVSVRIACLYGVVAARST
nr:hypothetical protein B0A51_12827 [Rachicladosporium sp. CCFEE 5018]